MVVSIKEKKNKQAKEMITYPYFIVDVNLTMDKLEIIEQKYKEWPAEENIFEELGSGVNVRFLASPKYFVIFDRNCVTFYVINRKNLTQRSDEVENTKDNIKKMRILNAIEMKVGKRRKIEENNDSELINDESEESEDESEKIENEQEETEETEDETEETEDETEETEDESEETEDESEETEDESEETEDKTEELDDESEKISDESEYKFEEETRKEAETREDESKSMNKCSKNNFKKKLKSQTSKKIEREKKNARKSAIIAMKLNKSKISICSKYKEFLKDGNKLDIFNNTSKHNIESINSGDMFLKNAPAGENILNEASINDIIANIDNNFLKDSKYFSEIIPKTTEDFKETKVENKAEDLKIDKYEDNCDNKSSTNSSNKKECDRARKEANKNSTKKEEKSEKFNNQNSKQIAINIPEIVEKVLIHEDHIFFHGKNQIYIYTPWSTSIIDVKSIDIYFSYYLYILTETEILVYGEKLMNKIKINIPSRYILVSGGSIFLIDIFNIYNIVNEEVVRIRYFNSKIDKCECDDKHIFLVLRDRTVVSISLCDMYVRQCALEMYFPNIQLTTNHMLITNGRNGIYFFNKDTLLLDYTRVVGSEILNISCYDNFIALIDSRRIIIFEDGECEKTKEIKKDYLCEGIFDKLLEYSKNEEQIINNELQNIAEQVVDNGEDKEKIVEDETIREEIIKNTVEMNEDKVIREFLTNPNIFETDNEISSNSVESFYNDTDSDLGIKKIENYINEIRDNFKNEQYMNKNNEKIELKDNGYINNNNNNIFFDKKNEIDKISIKDDYKDNIYYTPSSLLIKNTVDDTFENNTKNIFNNKLIMETSILDNNLTNKDDQKILLDIYDENYAYGKYYLEKFTNPRTISFYATRRLEKGNEVIYYKKPGEAYKKSRFFIPNHIDWFKNYYSTLQRPQTIELEYPVFDYIATKTEQLIEIIRQDEQIVYEPIKKEEPQKSISRKKGGF